MTVLLKAAKPPVSPAWVATFADLAALLLTFFVLTFSMSTISVERWHNLPFDRLSSPDSHSKIIFGRPQAAHTADRSAMRAGATDPYLMKLLQQRLQGALTQGQLLLILSERGVTLEFQSSLDGNDPLASLPPVFDQIIEIASASHRRIIVVAESGDEHDLDSALTLAESAQNLLSHRGNQQPAEWRIGQHGDPGRKLRLSLRLEMIQ